MAWRDYQKVVRRERAFIVAAGHQAAFERVLSEHGAWLVVEKLSEL
ncbi:MAG: hypothetical protein KY393_03925 [Actinobacteria bacterium]|nr:hypothetical protein [Actinomycetota bacterium]